MHQHLSQTTCHCIEESDKMITEYGRSLCIAVERGYPFLHLPIDFSVYSGYSEELSCLYFEKNHDKVLIHQNIPDVYFSFIRKWKLKGSDQHDASNKIIEPSTAYVKIKENAY
ncbi:ATP synthase gamma chain [Frankliniella fusca]|uniref:ATP synthase gamma chain n=1 Tax=Frankliniella fusca TaxID=407009 RepID=A0AAE1LFR8_9NEOP|nr:ATP synthase gamma chain [Frankliniella fusca]